MEKFFNNFAFRTTFTYFMIAGLWIFSSDWILGLLVQDPKMITMISLSKGWLFVIVTAIILYFQLLREMKQLEDQESKIIQLNCELEQRVQTRTQELQMANQELEAFSYSVSHDLRAPLRRIDGFDRILQEDYASLFNEKGINYLDRIHEASQQMGKLIDALLQLSRVSRGELTLNQINLSQMVNEMMTEFSSGPRKVTWKIHDHMTIRADPDLIRIVLSNLIDNAFKFTRDCQEAMIEIGQIEKDGRNWYFVRDNGAGFDMNKADHLFETFHRLHSDFEGTGIGLTSVKRIIRRHNGEIQVEAQVDKGATFYFYV